MGLNNCYCVPKALGAAFGGLLSLGVISCVSARLAALPGVAVDPPREAKAWIAWCMQDHGDGAWTREECEEEQQAHVAFQPQDIAACLKEPQFSRGDCEGVERQRMQEKRSFADVAAEWESSWRRLQRQDRESQEDAAYEH